MHQLELDAVGISEEQRVVALTVLGVIARPVQHLLSVFDEERAERVDVVIAHAAIDAPRQIVAFGGIEPAARPTAPGPPCLCAIRRCGTRIAS